MSSHGAPSGGTNALMAMIASQGPPYRPIVWGSGGMPKKSVDVPITAVFLVLFVIGAGIHMFIYQKNRVRGHKFLFNLFLFIFCMARILTCSLRLASLCNQTNVKLAIAASVFVAAGILIVFIINLIWAQRVVRSLHPKVGWHPLCSLIFKALYVLIGLTLAIVITATVQSFYTLRPRTRTIDRSLQLYGATFLTIISFLPLPILALAFLIPRKTPLERFGKGRHRTKVGVLLTGTTLCCLGAAFRCGTSWMKPVSILQPLPHYYSKACFYIFNFTLEILVVYLYAIARVDLRFHIPNGAKGPGSYEASMTTRNGSTDDEKKQAQGTEAARAGSEGKTGGEEEQAPRETKV